jgi:VWFA-related protein
MSRTLNTLLLFPALVLAQVPVSSAQTSQSSGITIKSTAQIVIVDVIVSTKDGKPVHDLKAEDFVLTENGKREPISHFEEHVAPTAAQLAAPIAPLKLPSGVFTNYSPRPAVGPLNILLLDKLNTPTQDQDFVTRQLLQFLKNSPPGSRIAIFGLTTHLFMLQGFTSDPELLLAAIEKPHVNGVSPNLNSDPVTGAPTQTVKLSDAMQQNGMGGTQAVELMKEFETVQATAQTELRVRYTLDAMNQLALYLSGIPGRKNLMWFSGSFPINILPDTSGQIKDSFLGTATAEKEFRETTNLFTRGQVAVYPIDATGLYSAGMKSLVDASNAGRKYSQAPQPRNDGGPIPLPNFSQDLQDAEANKTDVQQTMYRMAYDTGGHAFVNTNGLATAVSQAIALGSNYYTLTYSPSNHNSDGRYRKIQVKLAHQNYSLAYRHGYYAGDPNIPYRTGNIAAAPTRYSPMQSAMAYGAPNATQIIFKVAVDHNAAEEESLAPENKSPTKLKGPFRVYNVHYAVSRDSLTFDLGPDGTHQGSVGFDILLYNQDGAIVNTATSTIRAGLSTEAFNKLQTIGVQFSQPISVPVKGTYYLRVGIHDLPSDRVGAVEVPVASIGNQSPLAATSSAKPAPVEPK